MSASKYFTVMVEGSDKVTISFPVPSSAAMTKQVSPT